MSLSSKQVTTGAAPFAQATPLPTAGPARLPGSPRVGDVRPASEDPTPAHEARGPWLPCRATVPAAHALAWAARPQSHPQGKGTTCETRREQSEDPRNPDADAASNRLVGGSRPTQAPPPAGAPPPPAVPRPSAGPGEPPGAPSHLPVSHVGPVLGRLSSLPTAGRALQQRPSRWWSRRRLQRSVQHCGAMCH